MKTCKYYTPHFKTIRELISCLYSLEGCCCGGLLHILVDDNNYEDHHITFCMQECLNHPEREESKLGLLICEEILKLSMNERHILFYSMDLGLDEITCHDSHDCNVCEYIKYMMWTEEGLNE